MNVNDINMGANMGHWNEKNLIGMLEFIIIVTLYFAFRLKNEKY